MPRGDGTGPFGTGPIGGVCVNRGRRAVPFMGRGLGRAMGFCAGGLGLGLGLGLRRRGLANAASFDPQLSDADRRSVLAREKEILTEQLKDINDQLEDQD